MPIIDAMEEKPRPVLLVAAVLGMLTCCVAARAQAVLLVVEETLNGTPLPPPFASHEGIAAALFDDGIIVLDLPGGAVSDSAQLSRTAVSAGADYVLAVTVDYATSGSSAMRVDAHAAFRLFPVPSGNMVLQAAADGTNKGRERTVDRAGLGDEVGRVVAGRAWAVLRQAAP
jgi:hypothetical protein